MRMILRLALAVFLRASQSIYAHAEDALPYSAKPGDTLIDIKARPESLFITSPQDGGSAYDSKTHFRWSQVDDVQSYHFQPSAMADFALPLSDFPG